MNLITDILQNKKIIILGFGKEGVSSYKFIRKYFPDMDLVIADKSPAINLDDFKDDPHLTLIAGEEYNQNLNAFDLILKSPGVNLNSLEYFIPPDKITSQTDLFMRAYATQVIGVTGTKGKSTTASLIYHILNTSVGNTFLAGNIGIPFFDIIDQINQDSIIVGELSAHQLEFLQKSPRVAILLNIYQEHLDHFNSFSSYQIAKLNIVEHQEENDIVIYNANDFYIPGLLAGHGYQRTFFPFSHNSTLLEGAYSCNSTINLARKGEVYSTFKLGDLKSLPGTHNYNNIMAAILACKTQNVSDQQIMSALKTFKGLEHRIEFVGNFNSILFYNDSISTIPEATIAAIETLKNVDTLIIGGFDRGIDYSSLIDYLHEHPVENIVFVGKAGERIFNEWKAKYRLDINYILENEYAKIVDFAFKSTQKNKICLLSPAASSYDQFKNFEERGRIFKELVRVYKNG